MLGSGKILFPDTESSQHDGHLMISDPDFFLEELAEAGSDSFWVHWEGNNNLDRTIRRIKDLRKRAGIV
jgi:ribulose-phosphate 3-epimerase